MTRNIYIIAAAGGSLALLLGAFAFQYIGGLPPCKMCIWQRWPHVAAILLGVVGLTFPRRAIPALGALAAFITSAIGVYHTGVERDWWEGPTTCTSGPIGGISAQDLMDQIMAAPLVRCDDVPWEMLGLSMASWNAVLSFGFALLWIKAFSATR